MIALEISINFMVWRFPQSATSFTLRRKRSFTIIKPSEHGLSYHATFVRIQPVEFFADFLNLFPS
jgi:hypothetical protein